MRSTPRTIPGHDDKTLIVDHVNVRTASLIVDGDATLGIVLELDGRYNTTRRRGKPTIVIGAEQLGDLLTEIAWHGSAGQREFVGELEAALRTGHERLLKEGAPS